MTPDFENTPSLGRGIYTVPDIAHLLDIPYYKANRWINEYWDRRLAYNLSQRYSWTDGKAKAVSFHTLVELYTFFQLSQVGVRTNKILEAHKVLARQFDTAFPFATSYVLNNMFTDGRSIFLDEVENPIITLDISFQLNLDFVKLFFKKLEFDSGELANRLWPLGKDRNIVIDPQYKFGQPTINGTNILPSTIASLIKAGETEDFVMSLYNLEQRQVHDALEFHKLAA